ncbi:MAG: hypothetical protein ABI775_10975, partial [Pseudonocardiales bacterium]
MAAIAQASAHVIRRDGQETVEAEAATLTGQAAVVQANPVYTGEAQWSGGAYVQVGGSSGLSWTIPAADQRRLLQAVVNRIQGPAATMLFATSGSRLGRVRFGGGGARGNSATAGRCLRFRCQSRSRVRQPCSLPLGRAAGNSMPLRSR